MHPNTGWARRVARPALTVAATAAVALGFAAPASAAEGQILGTNAPDVIENSYIVILEDDASPRAFTAEHDGKVTHTFSTVLNGYAATMSEADARRIAADSDVAYVEQNREVHAVGTQTNPPSWGLDRVDQRTLPLDDSYTYPNTGSNVTAYVIDTGIRITHNDFGGRASWGTNTADSNDTDCNGHGTHVAGTIGGSDHGIAKDVDLVAVKVLNCQGSGTLAGVAAGIDWVTQNAQLPAVANMSLGATGANTTLENAVRNSISAGVTYAIASGNSSADACNFTPARTPEAITVNSTDSNDSRSSFSNYGTCTDIFAPGRGITSAWNTSDSATNTISGTSMATPHVAGAAAVYLSDHPSATPAQVQTALKDGASKNKVSNPGSGSPNNLLFVGEGTDPDPGDPPDEPGDPGDCPGTTPWNAGSLYFFGDQVSHAGHMWMLATWFSIGEAPGTSGSWFDLGAC